MSGPHQAEPFGGSGATWPPLFERVAWWTATIWVPLDALADNELANLFHSVGLR